MHTEILIRKNSSLVLISYYLLMESAIAVMHFCFCVTSKI